MNAIKNGKVNLIAECLEKQINFGLKDDNGDTIMHLACKHTRDRKLLKKIIDKVPLEALSLVNKVK